MEDILTPSDLVIGQTVTLWRFGGGTVTARGEIRTIDDAGHVLKLIEESGREVSLRLSTPYFWLMLFDSRIGDCSYSEHGPFYVFRTPS